MLPRWSGRDKLSSFPSLVKYRIDGKSPGSVVRGRMGEAEGRKGEQRRFGEGEREGKKGGGCYGGG